MNLDILTIHLDIINYLQNPKIDLIERQRLVDLKQEFEETKHKLSNNVAQNLAQEIERMENNFKLMDDYSLLNFYLLYSVPLIEKYKQLCLKPVQVCFMKGRNENLNKQQKDKLVLIKEYVYLTHRFFKNFPCLKDIIQNLSNYDLQEDELKIKTPLLSSSSNNLACENCKNSTQFHIYDNQSVCQECGTVIDQFQNNILSFKDIERVNISSKYTYDRRTHFRDCFYQFQGKQNVTIHPTLYQHIINQLVAHGIVPENYNDLPKEMAFEKVEKEHINIFLKDSKFVKHYEDSVLIYHTLTGKSVPDLSHLEESLMNDFDILIDIYDKTQKNNTDRKNFINTQYVLFQLLRRHKYPCQKEEFNILKTIDRKYYHDEICSKLFSDLGWNFQPLF